MNTSEVLNKMADLIEERSWTCGAGWDPAPDGPLCIEGALQTVLGVSRFKARGHAAYIAMQRHVESDAGLWIWNDHRPFGFCRDDLPDNGWLGGEGQERAYVVEALRAAAVIEAAKETATPAMDGKAATKAESADEGAVTV